jgi:MYXO-CTERM domain-containing protein
MHGTTAPGRRSSGVHDFDAGRGLHAAAAALSLALLGAAAPAAAAGYASFDTLAAWQAAVGEPVLVQTFQGFSDGAPMNGVEFLPAVSAGTNMDQLRVFVNVSGAHFLFGYGGTAREAGLAEYTLALTQPYRALALDITSFEAIPGEPSTATGPGQMTVFFADSTSANFSISGNLTGEPVFFGVVADSPIVGLRWIEALEGSGGSEETGLDNVRVSAVPEPATWALGLLGLATLGLRRRWRDA